MIFCGLLKNIYAEDIYQYTTNNGTTVFTNKPVKNAQKVTLPPLSIYASPMSKQDYHALGYTNGAAQQQKDKSKSNKNYGINETGRLQILNEELQHEKQGLTDAKAALALAKQGGLLPSEKNNPTLYKSRIQALDDAVTEHQKNIQTLTQQLAGN